MALKEATSKAIEKAIMAEMEERHNSRRMSYYIHDLGRDLAQAVEAHTPYLSTWEYYYGVRGQTMKVSVTREVGG